MAFDPIDVFREEPPGRPDPFSSTGGEEAAILLAAALLFGAVLFLVLFPIPLILVADAYDDLRGLLAGG